MGTSAILPRAFERWERRLGFGARLEIQSAQLAKHALCAARQAGAMLDGNPLLFEKGLAALEARIQFLQIDFKDKLDRMRKMEGALARYRSLFDKAPIGFHMLSPEREILEVNDRRCLLLGYGREEMLGHSIFEFIVDEQVENATTRFEERLRGVPEKELTPRDPEDPIRRYKRKDGGFIYVETQDTVFRDENGVPVMVLTSFQDITARVEAEEKLVRQEREAALGHMAAAVSHTFKHQIAVVEGLVWKLGELFSRQRRWLETEERGGLGGLQVEIDEARKMMEEYVRKMGETTRGFLTFSRVADEEKTIIGVRQAVEEHVSFLKIQAEHKGAALKVSFHRVINSDGILIPVSHFQDVIRNLVTNSIEAGAKVIRVIVAKTASGRIKISVQDDGAGIEPKLLPQLLNMQVKSLKGGTGIGLSLVNRIIAACDGNVFIRSRLGRGTTVAVDLPRVEYAPPVYEPEKVKPVAQIDIQTASGITIMVVDDDVVHCELLSERLGQMGYRVVSFQNPLAAIEAYERMENKPQIIITDMTMPALTGTELIERIAGMSAQARPQFAIYSGDREIEEPEHPICRRMEEYDVAYLIKPVSQDVLRQKIEELALRALAYITT